MAGGAGSSIGKGGMITKVIAAKRAAKSGAHTAIASGREIDPIIRLANGESVGTLLVSQRRSRCRAQTMAGRPPATCRPPLARQWCGQRLKSGKSLLPIGVSPPKVNSNAARRRLHQPGRP
jgi:glutamate 5-kinase